MLNVPVLAVVIAAGIGLVRMLQKGFNQVIECLESIDQRLAASRPATWTAS